MSPRRKRQSFENAWIDSRAGFLRRDGGKKPWTSRSIDDHPSNRRFPRHPKKGTNVAQSGTNGHPKDEWAQSGTNGRNRKRRRRRAAMNLILLQTTGGWHLFSPYFPAPPQNRRTKTGLREVLLRTATEPPPQSAGSRGRLAVMAMTRRAAVAAFVHFLKRLSQRDNAQRDHQRPYRRRSRSPSPPTSKPNTALKPFGSISGTPETLTGLARRKPI